MAKESKLTDRQKQLIKRISKLASLSAELEEIILFGDATESEIDKLETEYQDLFSETILEFG